MTRGKPRDVAKEQHWRQALRRWQHSGLSIRAFCRREDLSEASFHSWRRTLSQRDPVAHPTRPAQTLLRTSAGPVTFVPLTIQAEARGAAPVCELVGPSGHCLRLFGPLTPALWEQLLAVLEDRPC